MSDVPQSEIDRIQQEWIVGICDRYAPGCSLHVGCGMKYIPQAINLDHEPGKMANTIADVQDLHGIYHDDLFDAVVSNHVLSSIPDLGAALREMTRVLKPGGIMAHVVPDHRYAPSYRNPHHPFDCQQHEWMGPQAFIEEVWKIEGLDRQLQTVLLQPFTGFNWSFMWLARKVQPGQDARYLTQFYG